MKKVIVYCYNRCSTCKKAIKYLEENIARNKNIELELKDIITEKPNLNEMIKIIEREYLLKFQGKVKMQLLKQS